MNSPLVFFSFVTLDDASPEHHRAYNAWHQLDHRPENLALPGVAWGDRWGRRPGRDGDRLAAPHEGTDYIAMYWFRDPVEESVAQWEHLARDSFQWGRGPIIPGVRRTLLGFFRPVQGYAAPSALVGPGVLPYRPARGVHLTLTRHQAPYSLATHEHHTWEDRELIPRLLEVPGVAGAWTFSFERYQALAAMGLAADSADEPGSLRVRLVYLDGDPVSTSDEIDAVTRELDGRLSEEARAGSQALVATTLHTLDPWQDR